MKWDNEDLVTEIFRSVERDTIVKGLQRGLENLVNAKPIFRPDDEADQDDLNAFCQAFEDAHLDILGEGQSDEQIIEAPDRQQEETLQDGEWEPMPLDNYDGIDRVLPGERWSPRPPPRGMPDPQSEEKKN